PRTAARLRRPRWRRRRPREGGRTSESLPAARAWRSRHRPPSAPAQRSWAPRKADDAGATLRGPAARVQTSPYCPRAAGRWIATPAPPRRREESHGVHRSGAASADAGEQERARLLQHLARHHETLDPLRALVDLRDLRVAHVALDRVLADVPVAAEDLHRVGGDGHGDVAALELRHRRRFRELGPVDAVVDHLTETVEQPARRLALGLHVGELRLDELVLGD